MTEQIKNDVNEYWQEDKDQLIIYLNQQILDGQTQIGQLQSDLLDMMELVSTLGGEASV